MHIAKQISGEWNNNSEPNPKQSNTDNRIFSRGLLAALFACLNTRVHVCSACVECYRREEQVLISRGVSCDPAMMSSCMQTVAVIHPAK